MKQIAQMCLQRLFLMHTDKAFGATQKLQKAMVIFCQFPSTVNSCDLVLCEAQTVGDDSVVYTIHYVVYGMIK